MPRNHQRGAAPEELSDSLRAGNGRAAVMNGSFDVVVVGAGPAGIAAAVRAAEAGGAVALGDDNLAAGGQIWRGGFSSQPAAARQWLARLNALPIRRLQGWRIFDSGGPGV